MARLAILLAVLALLLGGCAGPARPGPGQAAPGTGVEEAGPVRYRCADGVELAVRYGRLADGSLEYARLALPDGRKVTLPRVVAASGVRYTDELDLTWWTKGETAFLMGRGADGDWTVLHDACTALPGGD